MSQASLRAVNPVDGTCLPARRTGAVELSLLDGFELRCDGDVVNLSCAARRLMALLALHRRPVTRSFVAGTLWIDLTEERATANLRSTLWRMPDLARSAVAQLGTLMSLASHVWVDVSAADAIACRLLDEELTVDDVAGLADVSLDRSLLAFDLLPDWCDEWVVFERERRRQRRLHALEVLCRRLTAQGRFGQAVDAGLAAVVAEPLRESAHRVLIRTYLAEGNYIEALREFEAYRNLLEAELQLRPSLAMEELVGHLPDARAAVAQLGASGATRM